MRKINVSCDVEGAYRNDPSGEYIGQFAISKRVSGPWVGYEISFIHCTFEYVTLHTLKEMRLALDTVIRNADPA